MPVLSLACHLRHNTPNIPSRYNNGQTTKQTKAINNSYIYINISCKCDTNRAGHFTLDAYASRPVACANSTSNPSGYALGIWLPVSHAPSCIGTTNPSRTGHVRERLWGRQPVGYFVVGGSSNSDNALNKVYVGITSILAFQCLLQTGVIFIQANYFVQHQRK